MQREIDSEYFRSYAGSNENYEDVFREFSRVDECLDLFRGDLFDEIQSVCVLGSATGSVLQELQDHFQVEIAGCEISRWAFAKTPLPLRRFVCNQDMREFIWQSVVDGRRYDLVFTNSLVYLPEEEIPPFLNQLGRVAKFVHFHSSFRGACCPDPYRATLRSYAWWNQEFAKAGFSSKSKRSENARYLWENLNGY